MRRVPAGRVAVSGGKQKVAGGGGRGGMGDIGEWLNVS